MVEVSTIEYPLGKVERIRNGLVLGASLVVMSASQALAQDAAGGSTGVTQLQQLVVTAAGFEQNVKDAPASITVITREELEKGAFKDLTDALKEVQGVTVTGAANENDILIRGLPGNYTLILVDGKRQNTRNSRPNGSSGLEQSFIPPISAIERIEIVRGPMSSLYGSDAMGGVINIITRKVSDTWTGTVSVDGTLNGHSRFGNAGQTSFYISGPVIDDKVGIQVWGRGLLRGEDKLVGGTQERKEGDIGGKLTITPSDDHEIYIEGGLTRVRSLAHAGKTVEWTSGAEDTYRDYDRAHWSVSHVGHWGWTTSEITLSQEDGRRTNYSSPAGTEDWTKSLRVPRIRNTTLDAKFTTPFDFMGQHTLVTGGQYLNENLRDTGHTSDYLDLSADSFALFGEDEWKITDDFALTGGVRYNHHQRYGSHVTPRLYAVWDVFEGVTIKGGVSTGFTAPEIRAVTPSYYYPTQRGAGVIAGNPDLKPEESTSYEIGILYDSYSGFTAGATYFYTDFTNKIANENTHRIINPETGRIRDPGGNCSAAVLNPGEYCLWRYFNIDGAIIQGVELAATWEATPDLTFRGTYTYTHSEQTSGEFEGEPLTRTPKHQASLRADWSATDKLDLWATVSYHGEQVSANVRQTPRVRTLPAYTFVDVGLNYRLGDSTTLKGAVYNLFDKQVDPDDYLNSLEGRRFWVGLTSTF
ncbi:TonB-dependent siderophore receptor [Chelativorans composti]|jgi:Outer membrane receptor for ferrienterochelin and colicins|uniref:TonB-dependent receptor domain-containing protein n=1 Tax=Chelativorans composti TaxID=768533 RepID=A0ABW5DBA6_9HYPH